MIIVGLFPATGEPPICMSISVLFALRNAIDAARKDAGQPEWYQLGKYLLQKSQWDWFE